MSSKRAPRGLTKAQVKLRERGIGASEVGAILGVDPRTAPLDVYARKVGLAPAEDSANEPQYVRMGRRLEGVLLDEYEFVLGVAVRRRVGTLAHPSVPWALCSPDGLTEPRADVGPHGVECKQRHWGQLQGWGPAGSGEVPPAVWAQCGWSMFVVDAPRWDVVAFLGGEFRVYHVDRDRELEAKVVEKVGEFWHQHIEKRQPPSLTADPEAGRRYLSALFPRQLTEDVLPATPEQVKLLRDYQRARELRDQYKDEAARIEVELLAAIGEHKGIEDPEKGGLRLTWTAVPPARVEAYDRRAYRKVTLTTTKRGK